MIVTLSGPDRAALPAILAAVVGQPGVAMLDIAEQLAMPVRRVSEVLTVLRREGRVVLIRYGKSRQPRWYPADIGAEVLERFQREAAERRREMKRQPQRLYSERRRDGVQAPTSHDDDDDGRPIRRRVDPTAPLPFVCLAPASVFHLGGMS